MGDKAKLKILFARDSDTSEHARKMVTRIEMAQWLSDPRYNPMPRGIAHHAAVTPRLCGDCGKTFWSRDDRDRNTHIGCSGAPKKGGNAGF